MWLKLSRVALCESLTRVNILVISSCTCCNVHLRSILWMWLQRMAYADFCSQLPLYLWARGFLWYCCDWDFVTQYWIQCPADLGLTWTNLTEIAPTMWHRNIGFLGLCFPICRIERGGRLRSLLDQVSRDSRTSLTPSPTSVLAHLSTPRHLACYRCSRTAVSQILCRPWHRMALPQSCSSSPYHGLIFFSLTMLPTLSCFLLTSSPPSKWTRSLSQVGSWLMNVACMFTLCRAAMKQHAASCRALGLCNAWTRWGLIPLWKGQVSATGGWLKSPHWDSSFSAVMSQPGSLRHRGADMSLGWPCST